MTGEEAPRLVRPTALDDQGSGLAEIDDLRVHVAGVLPGEEATALIEHVSSHRRPDGRREAWGRALEVRVRSPDRTAPACPAHGPCGGCPVQHLAYPAQLRWKREQVATALAGLDRLPEVEACAPSPCVLGYRNQGKYVYGAVLARGRPTLGAYAPRSHQLIDLLGCQVVEPPIDAVASTLRELLAERAVVPFDERRRTGLLRYCVLRSNRAGQVLVTLVTGKPAWSEGPALAEALRAARPEVAGVLWSINESPGNVIFGPETFPLAGQAELNETLAGVTVSVGPRVFLQLNREVAARIYAEVTAAAGELAPLGRVVELYAGVGAMSFGVAARAAEVVAIEENSAACAAGRDAAAAAGLSHVRFVTADAASGLRGIEAADAVILNPPRAGLAPGLAAAVAKLRPRLCAYVSCNPATLARDLVGLTAEGLRPVRLAPFDMLPHTPHVEVLALLK